MLDQTNPDRTVFLEQNQQEFAELLTFIDFSEGLTIGFLEVNQESDKAALVAALRKHLDETAVRLEVMNFSQERDLRFLRKALMQRIKRIQTDKKLVLLIQGLEVAIGTGGVGEYPPILQDLNFVRDAYRQSAPHPLLFVLPDYAITRISKFAPDFWAWKSGLFTFKTSEQNLEQLKVDAFESPAVWIASGENQAQIEQLNRLLMELRPSGRPIDSKDVRLCSEVYYKIGSAYLTQQQPNKARDHLLAGLKVMGQRPDLVLRQSLQRSLGNAYEQMRQFENAVDAYETALEVARSLNQPERVATVLMDLGDVALKRRQFEQAKTFYHQSLAIREDLNDRYAQASTYHQLGSVAQELREFEQARTNYQQALQIKIEFNDRYAQAITYHQLGSVAQELREFEQARTNYQQALQIFIEFNDRYSQASTYYHLGKLSEELGELKEAKANYLQDLQITAESNDEHGLGISLRNLARFYQKTQDEEFLAAAASLLGATVDELKTAILSD